MDREHTVVALLSRNDQLVQENDVLKSVLDVIKENRDLRVRMQRPDNSAREELAGKLPFGLRHDTLTERQFRKDLQQTTVRHEQRTSSPVDFKSFIQNSVHIDEGAESQSCRADPAHEVKGPDRLLGEIAFQLDRRILFYIFQGQRRLYGFTLLNIPSKIIEVSTHPLTGKVDEGYRLHLTQRYVDLMERLNQLGYKPTLHPPFIELIVNTYGILNERPFEYSTQATNYNNPDFLRTLIETTAPTKLQKDLLLVLDCLCNMAEMDGKPLLLW
ncbi:hypothetical protein ABVT39_015532 [Epinephelus coioides]